MSTKCTQIEELNSSPDDSSMFSEKDGIENVSESNGSTYTRRRATVMECEFGPRKRNNALKRLLQLQGHDHSKGPVLTCPARLFVKKVLKFPQAQVPTDSDPKVMRQLQEQSLKHVREQGFQTGEIRWYMQLPLPCAHRYHNVREPLESVQKDGENLSGGTNDHQYIDTRVLKKIQQFVRQGFVNPFLVRAAAKDFVENHLNLRSYEPVPLKQNKQFYPPLIEIRNIIQQTQAAINAGILTVLPMPHIPPVPSKLKRKRSASEEMSEPHPVIKKCDNEGDYDDDGKSDGVTSPSIPARNLTVCQSRGLPPEPIITESDPETISLTLTDNQLQNFSVSNFTYHQLAQLAKIGLLALNNAAKDATTQIITTEPVTLKSESDKDVGLISPQIGGCMTDDQSVLVTIPTNNENSGNKMGILSELTDPAVLGSPNHLSDVDVVR